MAVAGALLTASGSATDASSYTAASITPGASRLVLAFVSNAKLTLPETPTMSGNGLTWVQVETVVVANGQRRITVFRAMGATPTTDTPVIDFGGVTQIGAEWSISEYTGIRTTGVDGADAIAQSATATATVGTETALTVTLAAFQDAANGAAGGVVITLNIAIAVGTGWTELSDTATGHASPSSRQQTQWRASNDTTCDWTWALGSSAAGVAVEIREANVAPPSGDVTYARQRSMTGGFREMTGGLVG